MPEVLEIAEPQLQAEGLQTEGTGATEPKAIFYIYAASVFLSAFLLFQVQLIIGKYILPLFGGAPSVWNTCMFCFQVLLLLGYAYSHHLSNIMPHRTQGKVHSCLLFASLIVLIALWIRWGSPLTPGMNWRPQPGENPVWKVIELLGVTAALPFFVLSTTGPLLQKWFSLNSTSPYRLYAISNAGSLAGLLSYPFLVEWAFNIQHQAWLWSAGYVGFALLCTGIAWRSREKSKNGLAAESKTFVAAQSIAPPWSKYLLWLGLSACSTTILLATTNLLCQELAVVPLLWVLPLGVYLLTFILAFDGSRWYRRSVFWPLYFVALGLGTRADFLGYRPIPLVYAIVVCALSLFAVCMACHGELARSKPEPRYLTSFFVVVATGGALGGTFVVLVAPKIFRGFFEFQAGLIACGFLLFGAFLLEDRAGQGERPLWNAALLISLAFSLPYFVTLLPNADRLTFFAKEYYTLPLGLGIFLILRIVQVRRKPNQADIGNKHFPWQPAAVLMLTAMFAIFAYGNIEAQTTNVLFQERNFFGVKRVEKDTSLKCAGGDKNCVEDQSVVLINANTHHGLQFLDPAKRNIPTTYYTTDSGIGLLLSNYPRSSGSRANLRIGVIGLGAGTLAAYGRAGDFYRFYEFDPAVIGLSSGPNPYFRFVQDSPARIETVPGDARLSLEREAARGQLQDFDVLAIDAFSGDAIPVHLLTSEAMKIYLQHVRKAGGVLAFHISNRYLDLRPVLVGLAEQSHLSAVEVWNHKSDWVLLSANPEMLRLVNLGEKAEPIVLHRPSVLWTDSYNNLFQVWRHSR
jgi:hypothetical protein